MQNKSAIFTHDINITGTFNARNCMFLRAVSDEIAKVSFQKHDEILRAICMFLETNEGHFTQIARK